MEAVHCDLTNRPPAYPRGQSPNRTIENAQRERQAIESRFNNQNLRYLAKLDWAYGTFGDGGKNDFKVNIGGQFEAAGNFNYAVALSAMGISRDMALRASQFNQASRGGGVFGTIKGIEAAIFGGADAPNDIYQINAGYNYREDVYQIDSDRGSNENSCNPHQNLDPGYGDGEVSGFFRNFNPISNNHSVWLSEDWSGDSTQECIIAWTGSPGLERPQLVCF